MGVFSNNPVLEREVRGRLRFRRKNANPANFWVGVVLGIVIFYFYARGLSGLWRGSRQDALDFWNLLVNGLLALIVLLAPALSSTAITQERQQQTWDSLATTRLTGGEVVLGKWIGRQVILWLLIALALPYLLGCAIRGEISALSLLAALFFLLMTTAFYSVLGLLCSFQARRTAAATATSLTLTALLCVGTVIVNAVIDFFMTGNRNYAPISPVMWLNPFFALSALLSRLNANGPYGGGSAFVIEPNGTIVGFYFALTLLLTFAALYFMVSRYRRAVREQA